MEKFARFYSLKCIQSAFLLFCFPIFLSAQSPLKSFSKLSFPEKRWVIAHPFIAEKVFVITQRARTVTDSLSKNGILKDGNGGQLDAFRHAYWMALLVQKIPERKAVKLGKAHEKGNYLEWKKGMLEDSMRADSMLCVMDLENNLTGIKTGKKFSQDTVHQKSLEAVILENVKSGKMVMIKKNAFGQPEDKSGRIIVADQYKGKWYLPKVLVHSDYKEPLPLNK
ncbi:MAG: hypothetical protein ABIQ40_20800 [Bacteroidia bacterium]